MRRLAAWTVIVLVGATVAPACARAGSVRPDCRGDDAIFILAAQAVPSATLLPCVDVLLTGWEFGGSQIVDGAFRFWLDSDRAGIRAVEVELLRECDVTGAVEVIPAVDEVGTRRFERPITLAPVFTADRYYTFPGGCVEVEYRFADAARPALVLEADRAVGFLPRRGIVERMQDLGLVLCGVGAPECPGGD